MKPFTVGIVGNTLQPLPRLKQKGRSLPKRRGARRGGGRKDNGVVRQ